MAPVPGAISVDRKPAAMRLNRYANPKTLAGCPGLASDTDIALLQRAPNRGFEYQGPPIRNVASAATAAPGIFTSSMIHPADLIVRSACRGFCRRCYTADGSGAGFSDWPSPVAAFRVWSRRAVSRRRKRVRVPGLLLGADRDRRPRWQPGQRAARLCALPGRSHREIRAGPHGGGFRSDADTVVSQRYLSSLQGKPRTPSDTTAAEVGAAAGVLPRARFRVVLGPPPGGRRHS